MARILTDTEALHRLFIGETLYVGNYWYTKTRRGSLCDCCDLSEEFDTIEDALESLRYASDNFTKAFLLKD